jgi:hypothetical protein
LALFLRVSLFRVYLFSMSFVVSRFNAIQWRAQLT